MSEYYEKNCTPKKFFIFIDIKQDLYTECIIDMIGNDLNLLKPYLSQIIQCTSCKYNKLFSFHLQNILDNIYNHITFSNTACKYNLRKRFLFAYNNNACKDYQQMKKHQCVFN